MVLGRATEDSGLRQVRCEYGGRPGRRQAGRGEKGASEIQTCDERRETRDDNPGMSMDRFDGQRSAGAKGNVSVIPLHYAMYFPGGYYEYRSNIRTRGCSSAGLCRAITLVRLGVNTPYSYLDRYECSVITP